ncbi:MAG: hypothetical protein Q7W54_13585, partial [Bacteroidota bacterium]|nr:hypothetical protein [Bacteroidota bacterium]
LDIFDYDIQGGSGTGIYWKKWWVSFEISKHRAKIAKDLDFSPPTRIHFSNLKGFKTPTLKKIKSQTTILP